MQECTSKQRTTPPHQASQPPPHHTTLSQAPAHRLLPMRVLGRRKAGLLALALTCLAASTQAFLRIPAPAGRRAIPPPSQSQAPRPPHHTPLFASPDASSPTSTVPAPAAGSGMTEILARKAKEKEIAAFKAALPRAHPIFTTLEELPSSPSSSNQSQVLYNSLQKRHGNTLTVIAEYWRKAPFSFLGSVLEPREYSEIYREAGASVISINVDPLTGGCPHEDIAQMVAEQEAARREDVNAPIPIIASDVVVDPVQISRAKLAGAAGITLRYSLNPPEATTALIQTTLALGMEPLVFVKSAAEAAAATAAGARLLFLYGCTRAQGIEMRKDLPKGEEGLMVGYDLRRPREFQYGLNEVEDAWVLRDEGFNSVYVSNLLFQTPLDDVVGPSSVIKALRAKACHFMVDPLDWIEKAVTEGTKETLGELMA